MWFTEIMKFHLAITKYEFMSFAGKCIEQENIILSEISQTLKVKGQLFLSYAEARVKKGIKNGDLVKTEGRE